MEPTSKETLSKTDAQWDISEQKVMKKKTFLFALTTLLLCSCSSMQSVMYTETRSVELIQHVQCMPVVADLQISETRITYSEEVTFDFREAEEFKIKNYIEGIKPAILARAIKQYDADLMVAPIIDVKNESTNVFVITITGYPASYKNFRNATKQDEWFMQPVAPNTAEQSSSAPNKFKLFGK